MIILPTLYGLWQFLGMLLVIIYFQIWKFIHRHDVTVEDAKVVDDNTVFTRIPIPASRLPEPLQKPELGQNLTQELVGIS